MLTDPPPQPESAEEAQSIFPELRHPYYIVTPRYTNTSAGIKALHLLCHALNRAGERAYLVIHPNWYLKRPTHPDLLTPVLTPEAQALDFKRGLTPITVYPEVVTGNPFLAPLVVRYVLNFPGLLGGDATFHPDEYLLGYSHALAEHLGVPHRVLFIPVSDTRIFKPTPREQRRGTCFYAGKHKDHHRGKLLPITAHSTEITRDLPDSQTPEQIAGLLRRSELFYCYENSALAIEALLCECPVVFLPNEYFKQSIGAAEIGWDGIAWGADPAEIARAKATVVAGRANYLGTYPAFLKALKSFIADTQKIAAPRPYIEEMTVPHVDDLDKLFWVRKWYSVRYGAPSIVRSQGWLALFRVVVWRRVSILANRFFRLRRTPGT